ncbi:TPA: hypothetical protein ACNVX4_006306 [Pseudomonas aeruginosa]|uniref:hypothetical protein n=1 Tax=Pseudomonas aeruginosa TaxID=287 RepID=UPI00093CB177|nr:hypothetical protein [Pseudomonas aeruginosa]EKF7416796.1 hypothetical protein [Pseudomonas aeruginosa]MDS9917744.1 hypothetical protein [Pseudomonas aeruginosa]CAI9794863.1 Type I site-specific deoxyribonuclease [Pseudomonas aeruginosa]CAI9912252.1 Type I site-specific deoxyribonuclease [Pseudomonas aeruginosa]HBO1617552.1 hypothetical protein [Pseudomonas aeruginosa]
MTNMTQKEALELRQWVREVNALGEQFGFEDMAGTPDAPDAEYVERWREGETPEEVIAEDFRDA